MKKNGFAAVLVLTALSFLFGCQQKPQETSTMPEVSSGVAATLPQPPAAPAQMPEAVTEPAVQTQEAEAPQEFSEPSAEQIQQALKNAGLYDGEVDGKIGPKTQEAIENFQTQNNLKVDGKVGAQTWGKLKEYQNAAAPVSSEEIKN